MSGHLHGEFGIKRVLSKLATGATRSAAEMVAGLRTAITEFGRS